MADSRAAPGLTVEQWDDKYFVEYLSENRFASDMGSSETAIIQVKENLTKKPGDKINFALVNKLSQEATTGRDTMEGNEEDLVSRSHKVEVNKRRNAVRVAEIDEQFSAISLRNAAKPQLKEWGMKDTEGLLIQGLASINGTPYAGASDAQKDAWLGDNLDRVHWGKAAGAYVGTEHSAGLAALSLSNDILSADAISAMKYKARVTANPKIRPVRSKSSGRHYYIMYADPRCFRDLKKDPVITRAQREVALERENERLFQGGDLLWDGVIIKEIADFYESLAAPFTGVGSDSANVGCAFLCGAQALGIAYARRWKTVTEEFDYGDKHGVEISAIYGVNKLIFGSGEDEMSNKKDHGIVTGYFATSD